MREQDVVCHDTKTDIIVPDRELGQTKYSLQNEGLFNKDLARSRPNCTNINQLKGPIL